MDVPAFCDTCGAVFLSGFAAENSRNISFSGVGAGPCPSCGGMGHVPDGVFNFVGNTIEVLSAPARTIEELNRLKAILREAQDEKTAPEVVAEQIRSELPSLGRLAEILPKNRAEFYSFLSLIVAVIALLTRPGGDSPPSITVNQTINQVVVESAKVAEPPKAQLPSPKQSGPKVGRNEPCPCGSGKKYKKCCGKGQ